MLTHASVDIPAGRIDVNSTPCDSWQVMHIRRIVTFMGNANQTLSQTEPANNLSSAWQQRHDSVGNQFYSPTNTSSLPVFR